MSTSADEGQLENQIASNHGSNSDQPPTAANDGLTPANFNIPAGTDFATAGTGTTELGEQMLSVDVPTGATVERVFLYWSRREYQENEDNFAAPVIEINGNEITGDIIGGPVDIENRIKRGAAISYRADITDQNFVNSGTTTLTIQDDPPNSNINSEGDSRPTEPLGASVLVFFSEGSSQGSSITLFDGVDFIWAEAEEFTASSDAQLEALRTARPVTFNFEPTGEDRTGELTLFIGDIEDSSRPNSLVVDVGGNTTVVGPDPSPFQSFQGKEWDNYMQSISIPAGVSSVTVEPVSGPGNDAASLVWTLAGLSIERPTPDDCKVTEDCITIELLASTINDDGTVSYDFKVTSDCDRGLSFIAFELPEGVTAINPSTTAPLDKIENPGGNGGPFNPDYRNLKFELRGDFKGGDMATFSYTLPVGAGYDGEIRFRAKYSTTVTDLTLDAEECSLVGDLGDMPPPPVDDCDCEGKVRELTLQYNGDSAARIRVEQKKDGAVFDAMVSPGETFTFSGTDKKGTLGTEITIFIDDVEHADIHTSCSRPVGPGLIAGDFEVISGIDREGSMLCPVDADGQNNGDKKDEDKKDKEKKDKDKKDKDDEKGKKGKKGKGKKG